MKRIYRKTIWVVLLTFGLQATGLGQIAYALNSGQHSGVSSQKKTASQEWVEAISDLEKTLDQKPEKRNIEVLSSVLKEKQESLEKIDKKLRKEFKETENFLKEKNLPEKILQRHYSFVKQYEENYNKLKEKLNKAITTKSTKELKDFIEKAQYKEKKRPLDPNKLPHRLAPKLKPKEPRIKPIKTKAIKTLSEDYLSSTIDVQITDEIRKLARETLKGNPVLIYEYVRNNFDYEPYYGSLKGSQQTLWEKAGNDFDLASLLIALYRASNIPARYVYGTIEIPIEKAMNWVGVKDKYTAAQVFASGGIPSKAITQGGKIVAIQLEHCWVEAWVKYTPFEGAEVGAGDMWVPLDPSFKQYKEQEGVDFATEIPFDAEGFLKELKGSSTINEEEGYVTGVDANLIQTRMNEYQSALTEYIKTNLPNGTVGDLLGARRIKKEEFGILPISLPSKTILIQNRYPNIPDSLRHKVSFTIEGTSYTASTPELAGKRITLSYLYATDEDKATVESYGGIYNTPAYLVNLRPILMIEDETKIEGPPEGLGLTQVFTMQFTEPNVMTDYVTNDVTVGGYYAIGMVLQKIPRTLVEKRVKKLQASLELLKTEEVERDKWAGELLYITALNYFYQVDTFSDLKTKTSGITYTRHPSEAIISLDLDVSYLFGIPNSVEFTGTSIDVDRDLVSVFSKTGDTNQVKNFMVFSGMIGSAFEHNIFEQQFNIPSVSGLKVIQEANKQKIPIYVTNQDNFNQILPKLHVSQSVKSDIQNAVNAGKIVTVPEKEIQYYDWNGTGYIIQDPDTGAGAYMISGGITGGKSSNIEKLVALLLNATLKWGTKIPLKDLPEDVAKAYGQIFTIILFVLGALDIGLDSKLSEEEIQAKMVVNIVATCIIIGLVTLIVPIIPIGETILTILASLLGIIAVIAIINWLINFLKEMVYEWLDLTFIPLLRYIVNIYIFHFKVGYQC